jgi:DNA-directed RNA polymerase sigma subunit (sigma70/sigma32)
MMNGKRKAGIATLDAKVETRTQTRTLTAQEEKVVRMRHGFRAPETMRLEQVGQEHPETAAMLASIEKRALTAVGTRSSPTKGKIVSALRGKSN